MKPLKKILIPGLILATTGCIYYYIVFSVLSEQILASKLFALVISLLGFVFYFFFFFFILKWIKKNYYADKITFKEVFYNGVLIGIVATITGASFIYLFVKCDPSLLEHFKKANEIARQDFIDKHGSLLPGMDESWKATTSAIGHALLQLTGILYYIIYTLISAAILKTKKKE